MEAMIITVELNEQEIELIVQALRTSEKYTRQGFGRWVAKNADKVEPDRILEKTTSFAEVAQVFVSLRGRLGDDSTVKTD